MFIDRSIKLLTAKKTAHSELGQLLMDCLETTKQSANKQ